MTFSSVIFFAFLVLMLAVVALTKNETARRVELLAAAFVFYGLWDPRFLLPLCGEVLLTWGAAKGIRSFSEKNKPGAQKAMLISGIVLLLGLLGYYKYFKFFVASFCRLFGVESSPALSIFMPIGISFYTFSAIGYLIDVYRGEFETPVSLFSLAQYLMFFPKLLQGPLLKAKDFFVQLEKEHPVTLKNLEVGFQIFLFGLIKKLVIADRLGLFVNTVYENPAAYSGATLLLVLFAYPIQLYCDFSGYSDMAVGIARMFGYELCRNFNIPFLSKSVAEYWRRWHMSLNIWFRDYMFYSILRSDRVSDIRRRVKKKSKRAAKLLPSVIGMAIVWPLIGLWHGAAWTYVLYGTLYGVLMITGLIYGDKHPPKGGKCADVLRILRTGVITVILTALFRSPDLSSLFLIFRRVFCFAPGIRYIYIWALFYIPLVLGACIYAYVTHKGEGYYILLDLKKFKNKLLFTLICMMTIILMYVGENYFVYFQF